MMAASEGTMEESNEQKVKIQEMKVSVEDEAKAEEFKVIIGRHSLIK